MTTQLCPRCGCHGRWLGHASQQSDVDYYSCDCSMVWHVSKSTAYELVHVRLQLQPVSK